MATEDKIVLICAVGRSGSTTTQRILNIIPNSNICGENMGAINSLLEFYKRIKTTSVDYVPGHFYPATYETIIEKNVKPAWYNSYNFVQVTNMIRNTIIMLFKKSAETNVWGFKEIRYDRGNVNYLKEFKELFPQTKVIIQIRENFQAQSQSSWFKDDKNAIGYIKKNSKELTEFYKKNRDFCFFITFEKMFDPNTVKNMFKFIDCAQHYDATKIKDILNNNIKD
jgi:hypothetical protein